MSEFKYGDLTQNKWIKINQSYPTIHLILDILYRQTSYLDDRTVKDAIEIYENLLNKGISPKEAIQISKDVNNYSIFYS
jgi:hypothetical protein